MKMYKLQNTSESHTNYLSTILQTCSLASPDVCLITKEGHTVFTNKVLLVINSNMMAEVMVDNARDEMIRISVPVSSNTLINLIKILSHGITNSDIKFNPMEVLAAAEVLGITILDLHIGKETETDEQEVVDKKSPHISSKIIENTIYEDNDNNSTGAIIIDTKEVLDALQIDEVNGEKLILIPSSFEKNENLDRNFPCEICESRFKTQSGLGTHMLTHTGEKPFKCDKCEKSFNQRVNLERHTKLHTGLKPFKCEHCSKRCNRIDNLKKHSKIHMK